MVCSARDAGTRQENITNVISLTTVTRVKDNIVQR